MNAAEILDHCLREIEEGRWTTSLLEEGQSHCLIGMIGHALWGQNWAIDCYNPSGNGPYSKITHHPEAMKAARLLADQIRQHGWSLIHPKYEQIALNYYTDKYETDPDSFHFSSPQDIVDLEVVYRFNDGAGSERVRELVEKARANA